MKKNFLKDFWLKLNLSTKVIFLIFFIAIVLSLIGTLTYKPTTTTVESNSDVINRITNRNVNPLSFPLSYSKEWTGNITLRPIKSNQLDLAYSESTECSGVTKGMPVYYTEDLSSLMVINNPNLLGSDTENTNFAEAVDIITGKKEFFNLNAELQIFKTYCSFFSLYLLDTIDHTYPNTDYSRSIVGLGLRKGKVESIEKVGLFIYVYGIKDENIIQLSKSMPGNFIFSEGNWNECKTKNSSQEENDCLKAIYTNDSSMQAKIKSEALNLTNLFELLNAE